MVLDPSLIRLDPSNREVRINIEGSLESQSLLETLKIIESVDEFSGKKLHEILSD